VKESRRKITWKLTWCPPPTTLGPTKWKPPITVSGSIEEVSLLSFKFNTQPRSAHIDHMYMPPIHGTSQYKASNPINPTVIPYNKNHLAGPTLWDSNFCPVSIFGTKECFEQDTANIIGSIQCCDIHQAKKPLWGQSQHSTLT